MSSRPTVLCIIAAGVVVLSPSARAIDNVDTAWVRTYTGEATGKDVPSAITVDDGGNVYVAGTSKGNGTGADYLTLKYDPNGNLLWDRRYDGPISGDDSAFALVIDGGGNVYVTGGSQTSSSVEEIATLRYDSAGTLVWERRYAGPSSITNRARALGLHAGTDIYVAGFSQTRATQEDYVTLKYDSSGALLWDRIYNGPDDGTDCAVDLGVDGTGDVYVTGYSDGTQFDFDVDYLTLKYASDGTLLWERRRGGAGVLVETARAISVDPSDDVYVSGSITGADNAYVTVKYDPDGNVLWECIHDKSLNTTSEPVAMAADAFGNAFVAGRNYFTESLFDYTTVKCGNGGVSLWERNCNGTGNWNDEAYDVAVDADGNAYVTGFLTDIAGEGDCVTIKYNTQGDSIWLAKYDRSPQDVGLALHIDASGNVYVAGYTWSDTTGSDFLTIKYTPCTCACPSQGDGDADGFVTSLDLALIIDVLFAGATEPQDVCCPTTRFDVDCDGFTTALDLSVVIDYLFAGGSGPCDPCTD